ncbi:MAG: hypothetical protein WCG35_00275 [Betaproteobacteria bacterium]
MAGFSLVDVALVDEFGVFAALDSALQALSVTAHAHANKRLKSFILTTLSFESGKYIDAHYFAKIYFRQHDTAKSYKFAERYA